jgi:hypothetical protein
MIRRTTVFTLLLCTTLTLPACAGGLDLRQRVAGLLTQELLVGTALTDPIPIAPDSLEADCFVFSTTLGKRLTRVRFSASDARRAVADVQAGATVAIYRADTLVVDGQPVLVAAAWKARPEGNPLRAAFLAEHRVEILAWAYRRDPATLRFLFGDHMAQLRQLADELASLQTTLHALGIGDLK